MAASSAAASAPSVIPIRVLVRVRPFNRREQAENAQECLSCYPEHNQIAYAGKMFAFDAIFEPSCSQDDVFQASSAILVEQLFQGYNCTILAYGQTGSGKTFTMGTEETTESMLSDSRGIVPRIVQRIFDEIKASGQAQAFSVSVSMLEVYDDKVHDLLSRHNAREPLQIREREGSVFVQGLSQHGVTTLSATMAELEKGCQLRSKGETAMNETSSRSHAVFTVAVEKNALTEEDMPFKAKLQLVDLAGSERLKKTMAEGERKKEGIKINEGLHALGKVIQALSAEEKHVPYRDSKITRLLQDSLGGNSYTVMIACVSPADSNGEETLSTLRYADRVKSIKNKPTVNVDPQTAAMQRLREENAKLRRENAALRAGETVEDEDTVAPLPAAVSRVGGPMAIPSTPSAGGALRVVGTPLRNAMARAEVNDLREKLMRVEKREQLLEGKIKELVLARATLTERNGSLEERLEAVKDALTEADEDTEKMQSIGDTIRNILQESEQAGKKTPEREDDTQSGDVEMADEDDQSQSVANLDALGDQVDDIMKEIAAKEASMAKATDELSRFTMMQEGQKKKMEELQATIDKMQAEKDQLTEQIRKISASSKLAEERRKKLAELEAELKKQRKQFAELKNVEKMKKASDETIKRLKTEITEMKQLRVKITKQLKSETDKYRQAKMKADKQIVQLQMQDRKRNVAMAQSQQKMGQQLAVIKRKYEEAIASKKQLQTQLMRTASAQDEKIHDDRSKEQLKNYAEQELDLVGSAYSASLNIAALLAQREQLAKHMKAAKCRRTKLINSGEPPAKRRETDGQKSADNESELARIEEDIGAMQTQMDLLNTELAALQSESSAVDLEARAETRWSNVHTVKHARIALRQVFELASIERRLCIDKEAAREDAEAKAAEEKEAHERDVEAAEDKILELKRDKQEYIQQILKEKDSFDSKFNYMLASSMSNCIITDEQMEMMESMQAQIERLRQIAAKPPTAAAKKAPPKKTGGISRSASAVTIGLQKEKTKDSEDAGIARRTRGSARHTVARYGDVRNTMDAVPKEEGEEDYDDTRDTTYRIDGGRKAITKRTGSVERKVLPPSPILHATSFTSRRDTTVSSQKSSPAGRRTNLFTPRQPSVNRDENDENVPSSSQEGAGPSTADQTFVVVSDEEEEEEEKGGSGRRSQQPESMLSTEFPSRGAAPTHGLGPIY